MITAPTVPDDARPRGADQPMGSLPTLHGPAPGVAEPVQPVRLGHYVVLERLGAGGMGVVYAAFDERLERKVALKVLGQQVAGGSPRRRAAAQMRLLREARSLARLSHPNVVAVYEANALPEGGVFLAMELVKGMTLRAWQQQRRRSWRELVAMYAQAGAGLAAAHRAGIVHRDVKPENVLVGDDGRARVVDFGLAALVPQADAAETPSSTSLQGALTMAGSVMGTPGYMAPEQAAGRASDERGDQFGFCVALYEALYGTRPFADLAFLDRGHWDDETHPAGTASASTGSSDAGGSARRPRPTQVHAGWLWGLLDRGLALAPGDRFPSMDALLAELTRDRRRPRRLALAGGILTLVIGTASAAPALWQTAGEPCAPPRDALIGIWDQAGKQRASAALASTGLPFAKAAWRAIEQSLDGYAADWLAAHVGACEATHVQHAQSAALLDLRMECLTERARSLQAAADTLVASPARAAENADALLASLGDIDVCADTRALRLGLAPPRDATLLRGLERVRADLAMGHALLAAGDLAGAEAALAHAAQSRVAADYEPAHAEVLYLRGRLDLERGRVAAGLEALRQAIDTAVAARHDELAADVWLAMAMGAGHRHERPAEGRDWLRHAEAALNRLDHPRDPRRITAAHARGRMQAAAGHHGEAAETLARALDQARTRWGAAHPRVALLLHDRANALAMRGAAADALAAYAQALAIRLDALGPEHPTVASTRFAMGLVLGEQLGRLDEAEDALQEARRIYAASHGASSLEVGRVLQGLGKLRTFRGAYGDALAQVEEGLAIYEQHLDDTHPQRGEALMTVGVLRFLTGDVDGSLAAYGAALDILEPALGAGHVDVGLLRSNIGESLLAQGETDAAEAELARALDIMEAGWGAEHQELAFPLKGLGLARLARGRPDLAMRPLERALALRPAGTGDAQERAEIQWALARALGALGRASGRRRALAAEALAAYRGLGPEWHERASDIARWLRRTNQEE